MTAVDAAALPSGSARGPARLLDVTRLVSRAGRLPTGIDRVERAWLARLLQDDGPAFGLVRTPFGFLLLGRDGLSLLATGLAGADRGRADLLSLLGRRRPDPVRAAESALRRVALARSLRHRLGPMLARHLPPGTVSYTLGHANLTASTMTALRKVPGLRRVVMIHDTIPLDFPNLQREGTAAAFRDKFDVVARHADCIICPSEAAAADVRRHLHRRGAATQVVVAPLGVTPVAPRPAELPGGLPPAEPYVVALGTIEPRKNHALLLDVWERLGPEAPVLVICGARGWRNDATFARLDRRPPRVIEQAGLSDGAVAALLEGAGALLFPSLAEGFGLPLVEARACGTPVLCSDLPVFREVAGHDALYLDPRDPSAWAAALRDLRAQAPRRSPTAPPGWEQHFHIVSAMTC
jgi:glycosyltransferase involved in cell wall biosynthesis